MANYDANFPNRLSTLPELPENNSLSNHNLDPNLFNQTRKSQTRNSRNSNRSSNRSSNRQKSLNLSRQSSNTTRRNSIKSSQRQSRKSNVSVAEHTQQFRTAMNKGKRAVMSEAFMMKSYYYPSDDSTNSINGTFVIDFKNYSLDKKQKLQRGGAPDASICSDENAGHFGVGHLGHLDNVPIQTFAAVCDALYLSL